MPQLYSATTRAGTNRTPKSKLILNRFQKPSPIVIKSSKSPESIIEISRKGKQTLNSGEFSDLATIAKQ